MFFVVQIGIGNPASRITTIRETPRAVVQATSAEEAAQTLGLIEWDGWKKFKATDKEDLSRRKTWAKGWSSFFFSPLDTVEVDRDPDRFKDSRTYIRVIRLQPVEEWSSPVPFSTLLYA